MSRSTSLQNNGLLVNKISELWPWHKQDQGSKAPSALMHWTSLAGFDFYEQTLCSINWNWPPLANFNLHQPTLTSILWLWPPSPVFDLHHLSLTSISWLWNLWSLLAHCLGGEEIFSWINDFSRLILVISLKKGPFSAVWPSLSLLIWAALKIILLQKISGP